mgnify:FL=1
MSALARALIDSGRLQASDVERCLSRSQQRNTSLPEELDQAGLMESQQIADFIAQTFGFSGIDAFALETTPINPALPGTLYQDNRYLPVAQNQRQLVLAMADPTDEALLIAQLRYHY